MKVDNIKPVTGVDRAPATPEVKPIGGKGDRVTVQETQQVTQLAAAALHESNAGRAARLRSIEAAVRSGAYHPSPGRIADEILAAAEIDARLRALFNG